MKWLKALVGLAVVGGFVYGWWFLKSSNTSVPFLPGFAAPVVVKEGQTVPLVLLTPLDSGDGKEGDEVKLVVAEDVKTADGKVVIEQGAMATGKVVQTRASSLVTSLTNRPARLEVELTSVKATDGQDLKLRAEDKGEPYSFNQANTKIDSTANVLDAMNDPKARDFVVKLAQQIASGKDQNGEDKTKADEQLKDLAARYGLTNTQAFLKGGETSKKTDLGGVLESVQKGDLSGLSGIDLLAAAKAAGEIVELGSGIDKSLRGMFKGSNIHAKVGTPVKAYLAETVKVRPK